MVNGFKFSFNALRQARCTAQTTPLKKFMMMGWISLELIFVALSFPVVAQKVLEQKATQQANADYLIHSGDKLSVKFPYHTELNETALVVRPDGYITLANVGQVRVGGMTVEQVRRRLEKAYSESLVNPAISVNLTEFQMARVYVGGQVQKAGSFELRNSQTLMQGIILAGGFTADANRRLVLHARPTADGKLQVTQHDALALISDQKMAHDIQLQDGDYIFVPDAKLTKISRVLDAFRSVVPAATSLLF